MRVEEVPQDNDPTYHGQRKLCYAIGENGKFVETHTSGWNVESTVKAYAWEMIYEDLNRTREKVLCGQSTSLEYYMKFRMMDVTLLAQNLGRSKFRVWLHLKPYFFRKLKPEDIQVYADVLDVPLERFMNFSAEVLSAKS